MINKNYIELIRELTSNQISYLMKSNKHKTTFFVQSLIKIIKDLYGNKVIFNTNFYNGEFLTLDLTSFLSDLQNPFLIMEYENGGYYNVINDEFKKLLSVNSQHKILIYNYKNLKRFSNKYEFDLLFERQILKMKKIFLDGEQSCFFNIITIQYYNNSLILRTQSLDSSFIFEKINIYVIP